MAFFKPFRVAQAPTNPHPTAPPPTSPVPTFDAARLYEGSIEIAADATDLKTALDEKLRQAYFWIVNYAIISPHYDIEYNADGSRAPSQSLPFGDSGSKLNLPSGQSYSSY